MCGEGGRLNDLLYRLELQKQESSAVPRPGVIGSFEETEPSDDEDEDSDNASRPVISEGSVVGWHAALLSNPTELNAFLGRRGLGIDTITRFQIGWDVDALRGRGAYTIPIRTGNGGVANIRRYTLDPVGDRRKIWSVKGLGSPTLYPISILDEKEDYIIICEGELDALTLIENGFNAITRTASSTTWRPKWNHWFEGRVVYLCHDRDDAGQAGNETVIKALGGLAREIRVIDLPYPITAKGGKDVTDFFMEGHTAADFKDLMGERPPAVEEKQEPQQAEINVLDSFDARNAGRSLRLRVTLTGKKTTTYLVPRVVSYKCNMDAGPKCNACPMQEMNGSTTRTVHANDPRVLEMMAVPTAKVLEVTRDMVGAQKCGNLLTMDMMEQQAVEELFVRPSVERSVNIGEPGDYTSRKIVSVGRHDSMPNSTVEVVGAIFPNPKLQSNEFQAWDVTATETSIDRYEVTAEGQALMRVFQSGATRPLKKLGAICRDLAKNVTKIYGRNELHAMMDLVYHSALSFNFMGELVQRGWLEGLVIGDTRTGKSEVALRLMAHYGMGEMISCESATFAGIVGGLTQLGGDKEWAITWGAIPINDRRLVILDEVSGMQPEQIAQMSSIRSSGEAQLTKIRSERTFARTRLIWLGNPRNGRMSEYTFGVQAIRPLIGNNEDIARFDIAMSVYADEVDPEVINSFHTSDVDHVYTNEACRELVTWVWSRRAEHVVWLPGAEQEVLSLSLGLGGRYVEVPPLVQAANARIKIARLAVALACRTYSTDAEGEKVLVSKVHVQDAVKFMDILYGNGRFGYLDMSKEAIADAAEAFRSKDAVKAYLVSHHGLAKFLRGMGQFRSNDIQDILNVPREEANAMINYLWKLKMIKREGANIKIQEVLHQLLREMKD